jgi:hypothetical protein
MVRASGRAYIPERPMLIIKDRGRHGSLVKLAEAVPRTGIVSARLHHRGFTAAQVTYIEQQLALRQQQIRMIRSSPALMPAKPTRA